MISELKAKKSRNIKYISLFTLAISIIVIGLWLFNITWLLNIIPGVPPMEFITALSFLLLSLGVLASQRRSKLFLILNRVSITIVLIIATETIVQSIFGSTLLINIPFGNESLALKLPGRMTLTTGICFFLLGISSWGIDLKSHKLNRIAQYSFFLILLINFYSVISFILNIPGKDAGFLTPIPIHTSLILFWIAGFLSLTNASKPYDILLFDSYKGSKLFMKSGPFALIQIVTTGLLFLYLTNNDIVDVNTAFIIYTVMAAFLSLSNIFAVSMKYNKEEHEKIKSEKALSISTKEMNQYKEALDTSSLVDITDANGVILSVNDKFCEVSNYDRDELIGQTHKIINSGLHSKAFFSELWTKITRGEIWVGGIKNKTKSGNYFWVNTAIVPFKNEDGEIYQFLTIRQDITKHTLLTAQFGNLELKNKELEQFTYIASHDLQEPLRSVRSLIDILQEEYTDKLDKNANVLLKYMEEATVRMSELIKGLLDFSRIGREKKIVSVDSTETINELTNDLKALIDQKNTEITFDKLPVIRAYKTELRLLFQNLISNAIKFQKDGVTPQIHISAQEVSDYWKFSVKDNGIGIPQQDIRNVFAIFKRLNNRSNYEGTGIGLAHCEKIVHLHGGKIWVKSIEGEGSTFCFTILKDLY